MNKQLMVALSNDSCSNEKQLIIVLSIMVRFNNELASVDSVIEE